MCKPIHPTQTKKEQINCLYTEFWRFTDRQCFETFEEDKHFEKTI